MNHANPVPETYPPTVNVLLLSTSYDKVEPTGQSTYYDGQTIKRKFLIPPFGLYRVAHFIEKELGASAQVYVMDPVLTETGAIIDFIDKKHPKIIGFSPIRVLLGPDRNFMEAIFHATKRIFDYDPLYIAGGQDVATSEIDLFPFFPWLDLLVSGYGEQVLPTIIRCVLQNSTIERQALLAKLQTLPGIVYRNEHTIVHNPPPLILAEDFHRFAKFIGENIPYEQYWAANRLINPGSQPELPIEVVRIYTTAYCPFLCPFCQPTPFLKNLHSGNLYMLTADELLEMLKHIAKIHKAEGIYFNDDEMFSGRLRIKKFLELVIDAKSNGELPKNLCMYGQTRVDTVDDEILELSGRAGFGYISYGVESFSDTGLMSDDLHKDFTQTQAISAVSTSLVHIPITNTNLILFYPSVTRAEFITTVETVYDLLVQSLRTGHKLSVNPFLTVESYAGVPINAIAQAKGYVSEGRTVIDASGSDHKIIERYLPQDVAIRRILERDGRGENLLLQRTNEVFSKLREDKRWPHHPISRSIGINALAIFIAAFELLNISQNEASVSIANLQHLVFSLINRFEKSNSVPTWMPY